LPSYYGQKVKKYSYSSSALAILPLSSSLQTLTAYFTNLRKCWFQNEVSSLTSQVRGRVLDQMSSI